MKNLLIKSLAALTLSAAFGTALAQEAPPPPPPQVGVSGSAAIGIDFAASNTPGADHEKGGGFAEAIERAFGGDCGKLKCD